MAEDTTGTGSAEDEDVQDQTDGTEDDDSTEDDGEDPGSVLAERDKLRTTLAKIKEERKALRAKLAEAKNAKDDDEDTGPDPDERVRRLAGITALTSEGMSKAQAKVAVRLLDLSAVEVDEDGDADLDDAVEELKTLFPGLFAKPSAGGNGAVRRVTTADRGGRRTPATDPDRKMNDRLLRSAGYR